MNQIVMTNLLIQIEIVSYRSYSSSNVLFRYLIFVRLKAIKFFYRLLTFDF